MALPRGWVDPAPECDGPAEREGARHVDCLWTDRSDWL